MTMTTHERAKLASAARWSKIDWNKIPYDDALSNLAALREEYERAMKIVQQRTTPPAMLGCHICQRPIAPGKYAQVITYRDKSDQLIKNIFFCSASCISKYNKQRQDERFPDVKSMANDHQ